MDRSEKIGLGVAIAGHAVLFGLLSVGFLATPNPAKVDLFAEGPTPKWALPLPEPVAGMPSNGLQRFGFDLDGLPPGATADGATLKFTAVSRGQAIEVEYRLE